MADVFGHPLHVELAELLYWHDGTTNLPDESLQIAPDFGFIGLSDALSEWQLRCAGDSSALQDHPLMSWSPNWFPFGLDWCGGVIVLNHDQSRAGYGNVFATEPEQGSRRAEGWNSVTSLVRDVLESLHSGQARRDYQPVVDEGVLTWQ
ncbi:SMI1/KNR4 family protein [Micromonospora sp. U56]|nr:SMI1/KNR4 family protein [Micromonospora sp. U56]MBQ0896992.1 SMI1/KNR4 family protein [Micromonospora sp. U56]